MLTLVKISQLKLSSKKEEKNEISAIDFNSKVEIKIIKNSNEIFDKTVKTSTILTRVIICISNIQIYCAKQT